MEVKDRTVMHYEVTLQFEHSADVLEYRHTLQEVADLIRLYKTKGKLYNVRVREISLLNVNWEDENI